MATTRSPDVHRLVAAERAARVAGESAARWWSDLLKATDQATTDRALDGLLREALATVRDVMQADSVSLLIANETADELMVRASTGLEEEVTLGVRIHSGVGLAGRVMATRKPLIVGDLSTIELADPALRQSQMQSVVAVPVTAGIHVLGVLHAGSHQLHRFTEFDAELLELLADHLGLAVNLSLALSREQLFDEQARLAKRASFFAEAAKVIADASDLAEALDRLAQMALSIMGDICLIDLIDDGGRLQRLVAKNRRALLDPVLKPLLADYPPDLTGEHPVSQAIRNRSVSWSPSMSDEFMRNFARDEMHFALVKGLGFKSYLSVPIGSKDEVLGALTFVATSSPSFDSDDVEFAEYLSHQVEALIANIRRYELTVRTSHALQESMLPRQLPEIAGLTVNGSYEAATGGMDIGGDFYDLVPLSGGRVALVIGDVEGHDRGAATMMGQLRSAVRALCAIVQSPDELVAILQSSWHTLGFERIATAIFGELDPATGELVLASAGHCPPILLAGGRARIVDLEPGAPLAGLHSTPTLWRGTLRPGQSILFYTDGCLDERRFGVDQAIARLCAVAAAGDPDPTAVSERVISMLGPVRNDDVALLGLRIDERHGAGIGVDQGA